MEIEKLWRRYLPQAILTIVALSLMADYFFVSPTASFLSSRFLSWTNILKGALLIMGAVNLMLLYGRNVVKKTVDWELCILFFVVVAFWLVIGTASRLGYLVDLNTWANDNILTALTGSIFSIYIFYLLSAAFRSFRVRNAESFTLLISTIFFSFYTAPVGSSIWSGFPLIGDWLLKYSYGSTWRALGIGVGIGVIITGIKQILGIERETLRG